MSPKDTSIILLGDWGVGKSSMLAAHMSGSPQVNAANSTIGMSFCMLEPNSSSLPNGIACWDTAGQERYRALIPMYTRNAGVFICLVPSTSPNDHDKTRNNILTSITSTLQIGECQNLIHVALVMSKCDIGGDMENILDPLKKAISDLLYRKGCSAEISCHKCSSLDPVSCSAVFATCIDAIKDRYAHKPLTQDSITHHCSIGPASPPPNKESSRSHRRSCC